jgi:hypothetical protein
MSYYSISGTGKILLFTTTFISAWRPSILSTLWVIGAPSLELKLQGREANHTPYLMPKLRMRWHTCIPSWFAGSRIAVSLRATFKVRNFTAGRSLILGRACLNARHFTVEAAFVRLSHSITTYISCDTKCTSAIRSAIFRTNRWPLITCCNYVRKVPCTSCWSGGRAVTGPGTLRCKGIEDEFD